LTVVEPWRSHVPRPLHTAPPPSGQRFSHHAPHSAATHVQCPLYWPQSDDREQLHAASQFAPLKPGAVRTHVQPTAGSQMVPGQTTGTLDTSAEWHA
jgi:hypothetical protein